MNRQDPIRIENEGYTSSFLLRDIQSSPKYNTSRHTDQTKMSLDSFFPLTELQKSKLDTLTERSSLSNVIVDTSTLLSTYPNPFNDGVFDKITLSISATAFYGNVTNKKASQFIKEWSDFLIQIQHFKFSHPSATVFYVLARIVEESSKEPDLLSLKKDFFLAALHCNIYFFENYEKSFSTSIPVLLYKLVITTNAYTCKILDQTQSSRILEYAFKMFLFVFKNHHNNLLIVNAFDETNYSDQFPIAELTDCCLQIVFINPCDLKLVKTTLQQTLDILIGLTDKVSHKQTTFLSMHICKCLEASLKYLRTTEQGATVSGWEIMLDKLQYEVHQAMMDNQDSEEE